MSRTLFWYVFRDLLRIFFLTSGALAGIMSFGGLLRPLTQNGLDAAQVLLLLRYSMPAMSTYSLPVAALFATTSVYGRMSADNEITACRASGISFLSMATPAMLLGLGVSLGSMFLLCFTVPAATMKIEQVLVSNLAQIIAHQIEQTHEVQIPPYTIFAQDADLPPQDPKKPDDASVVLHGPMIVSYATPRPVDPFFLVVRQFYLAKEAIAYIHEDPDTSSATLRATLVNGVVLPRRFSPGIKSQQGGLSTAEFGPEEIPSPLQQKAKFMSILQLKALEKNPYTGQQVQKVNSEFIEEDQADAYAQSVLAQLTGPTRTCVLTAGGETYTVTLPPTATAAIQRGNVTLTAPPGTAPLRLVQTTGSQGHLTATTQTLKIGIAADTLHDRLPVTLDLGDALVDVGDGPTPQARPSRRLSLPMPPRLIALKTRTAQQYLESNLRSPAARHRLLFAVVDLVNHLVAEMHSRAAFVVSCLLLVLIGTALGMMFKSGNFLTAFAVSVVPAMFSIVLIVSGQHVAQATPVVDTIAHNPLNTGLTIIWASDVLVGVTAVVLLGRLQRQ